MSAMSDVILCAIVLSSVITRCQYVSTFRHFSYRITLVLLNTIYQIHLKFYCT